MNKRRKSIISNSSPSEPSTSTPTSILPSFDPYDNDNERLLVPPHYGKPSRPSSPDVFNALFHPVLRTLSSSSLRTNSQTKPPTHSSVQQPPSIISPLSPLHARSSSSLPSQFPPRNSTTDQLSTSPSIESQGFSLYLASWGIFAAYLVWSLGDLVYGGEEGLLESWGIEWYPNREWALLVPSWITMTIVYVYVGYMFWNMSITPTVREIIDSIEDPKSFVPIPTVPIETYSPHSTSFTTSSPRQRSSSFTRNTTLSNPSITSHRQSEEGDGQNQIVPSESFDPINDLSVDKYTESQPNHFEEPPGRRIIESEEEDREKKKLLVSRLYFDSLSDRFPEESIPPLYDLPIDIVNRVLYD